MPKTKRRVKADESFWSVRDNRHKVYLIVFTLACYLALVDAIINY